MEILQIECHQLVLRTFVFLAHVHPAVLQSGQYMWSQILDWIWISGPLWTRVDNEIYVVCTLADSCGPLLMHKESIGFQCNVIDWQFAAS